VTIPGEIRPEPCSIYQKFRNSQLANKIHSGFALTA
jgi:hypothetical protein